VRHWLPFALAAALYAAAAPAAPPRAKSSAPLLSAPPPPPVLTAPPAPPALGLPPAPPQLGGAPRPVSSADRALALAAESCHEHIPEGKERPKLTEKFPDRGESGHALTLSFTVQHGKGETVLPAGFQVQADDPVMKTLQQAGLYVPDPDGGAGPVLERHENGDRASTHVELSFVPLPAKPGRNTLILPSLPVSVARASGDVLVLCTTPHLVSIEDPTANTSDAMPRPNPPAREQREQWTALRNGLIIGAGALVLGALIAWLVGLWMKRPRPLPPPPPPRPPWEVALEELFDVRHAGLVAEGRLAEHFDRVSDTLRKYLGARFGFDGLESTTRESLGILRHVTPRVGPLDAIESFLRQADLVKFAKTVPTAEDGELALVRAEHIVRETLPTALAPVPGPPADAPTTDAAPAAAPAEPTAAEAEAAKWGPKPSASDEPGSSGEPKS
jgi:hypothetical protein